MKSLVGRSKGPVRSAALVLLATTGLITALAPAAEAGGILPSTTRVSASPSSGTAGDSVTLTAKVAAAIIGGAIITPSGTVKFTYTGTGGSGTLGSAKLGSCLLSACTATLTSSALPAGTSTVRGTYSGDLVVAPSSGTTSVAIEPPADDPTTSVVTCPAGTTCTTETVVSQSGTTTMSVQSSQSAGSQTVSAKLEDGKHLLCPGSTDSQTGALGTFEVTANDTQKVIDYTGTGAVGTAMFNNYAAHTTYVGCFASPFPFNGYVNGVYGPATLVHESDGDYYEAQLSSCANNGGATPCFTNINGGSYDTYRVTTPVGDPPKIIG